MTIRTDPSPEPFGFEDMLTRARLLVEQEIKTKRDLSWVNEEIDATRDILQVAFNTVADRLDWRRPIDTLFVVTSARFCQEELDTIREAIAFFTATTTTITATADPLRFKIQSIGYRAGPAGDH